MRPTIYTDFDTFVRRNGKKAGEFPGFAGQKSMYQYGRYTIILDEEPVTDEDLVVTVMEEDQQIYVSPAFCRGRAQAMGTDDYTSDTGVLERLLSEWKVPDGLIQVKNNGQDIISTNYWGTEWNRRGIFACTMNAGAFRLLLPDARLPDLEEMKTGKEVIISKGSYQGKTGFEFLFDDHTESPYSIYMESSQFLGFIPEDAVHGTAVMFSAWTRGPTKVWEMPARFRVVEKLPCMKPWRV